MLAGCIFISMQNNLYATSTPPVLELNKSNIDIVSKEIQNYISKKSLNSIIGDGNWTYTYHKYEIEMPSKSIYDPRVIIGEISNESKRYQIAFAALKSSDMTKVEMSLLYLADNPISSRLVINILNALSPYFDLKDTQIYIKNPNYNDKILGTIQLHFFKDQKLINTVPIVLTRDISGEVRYTFTIKVHKLVHEI